MPAIGDRPVGGGTVERLEPGSVPRRGNPPHRLVEEDRFGPEVIVDQTLRAPGGAGHLVDRQPGVPTLSQEAGRGVEDSFLAVEHGND